MEKTVGMRGSPDSQLAMLSSLSTEDLIPRDHPIRRIRAVVDVVLAELDGVFEGMYASGGRASVPPETLLKATVLMALYSIRSERAFCERLNYDLLFKWFLDLRIDQPAFDATTFTKNRKRLLDHEVADEFFAAVVRQAKLRRYVSSDHFSVDGTLLEAWASHKSFKPKGSGPADPGSGRNPEADFHGQKRSNETHRSTTDPESRLFRKSDGSPAKLCFMGHLLMEHRSALIIDAELSTASRWRCWPGSPIPRGAAPWPPIRAMTLPVSSRTPEHWGSRRMSRNTPTVAAPRSMAVPPVTGGMRSACGSANGSRNPSAGSKPSAADANSATWAETATGPGSK
jgi:transposase